MPHSDGRFRHAHVGHVTSTECSTKRHTHPLVCEVPHEHTSPFRRPFQTCAFAGTGHVTERPPQARPLSARFRTNIQVHSGGRFRHVYSLAPATLLRPNVRPPHTSRHPEVRPHIPLKHTLCLRGCRRGSARTYMSIPTAVLDMYWHRLHRARRLTFSSECSTECDYSTKRDVRPTFDDLERAPPPWPISKSSDIGENTSELERTAAPWRPGSSAKRPPNARQPRGRPRHRPSTRLATAVLAAVLAPRPSAPS